MAKRLDNYRSLLMDELKTRQAARVQFSATTFAKYLGLTRSHLNDIFKGRRGLSDAKARFVAVRLQLSPFESDFFVTSVLAEHGRSAKIRNQAQELLEDLKSKEVHILKDDLFRLVAEWQHFAILELMRLPGFRFDSRYVAKSLGIETTLAKRSMERLVSAGLVKQIDGEWTSHRGLLMTAVDVPSSAVKSFHSQISGLARKALYEQPLDRREFVSMVMAIDKKNIAKAKEKIRKFRDEMSTLLTRSDRNSLYCLGVQFFSLLQE